MEKALFCFRTPHSACEQLQLPSSTNILPASGFSSSLAPLRHTMANSENGDCKLHFFPFPLETPQVWPAMWQKMYLNIGQNPPLILDDLRVKFEDKLQ